MKTFVIVSIQVLVLCAAISPAVSQSDSPKPPVSRVGSSTKPDAQHAAELRRILALAERVGSTVDAEREESSISLRRHCAEHLDAVLQAAIEAPPTQREILVKFIAEGGVASVERLIALLQKHEHLPIWIYQNVVRAVGSDAVPLLLRQSVSAFPRVRLLVAIALRDLRVKTPQVFEAILRLSQDPDESVAIHSIQALTLFPDDTVRRCVDLQSLLADPRVGVRTTMLYTLAEVGCSDRAFLKIVAEKARSRKIPLRERITAIHCIGRLNPTPPDAIEILVDAIDDQNASVSAAATDVIARMGKSALPVAEDLIGLLKSGTSPQPHKLMEILQRFPSCHKELETAALKYFDDERSSVRAAAVASLSIMDTLNNKSLDLVIEKLNDHEAVVRSSAIKTLANHRTKPQVVVALKDASAREKNLRLREILITLTK